MSGLRVRVCQGCAIVPEPGAGQSKGGSGQNDIAFEIETEIHQDNEVFPSCDLNRPQLGVHSKNPANLLLELLQLARVK